MNLRALVVDDEDLARKNLTMLLHEYCDDVEVIGDAGNIATAKEMIEELKPDVVFLDIRMPSGAEGFDLLESIENRDFLVVFVTAFKDYALRAFNANAIHYVLKPVDIDDLIRAAAKITAEELSIRMKMMMIWTTTIKSLIQMKMMTIWMTTTTIASMKIVKELK